MGTELQNYGITELRNYRMMEIANMYMAPLWEGGIIKAATCVDMSVLNCHITTLFIKRQSTWIEISMPSGVYMDAQMDAKLNIKGGCGDMRVRHQGRVWQGTGIKACCN